MQILTFTVKDQILTAACPGRVVVEASREHVFAQFSLDAQWDGLTVTAVFQNDFVPEAFERLWTGEPVEVPVEVLVRGKLWVSLVGLGGDGSYRLTTRRMQTPVPIYQAGQFALTPEETTPELWEQVAAALSRQLEEAKAAAGDAQSAKAAAEAAQDNVAASAAAAEAAKDDVAASAADAARSAADAQSAKDAAEDASAGARRSEQNASDILDRNREVAVRTPYVGANGNWFVWDNTAGAYVDSGARAQGEKGDKGNVMYATFDLDAVTGELSMYTPDGYAGPAFAVNNDGELEVVING